jgi:ABC-2 type transport system ATP-binding protein
MMTADSATRKASTEPSSLTCAPEGRSGGAADGAGVGQDTVIEVHGLEMAYGNKVVLRGVELSVQRGEVFCLLGPNGAGKTTTVEILEGFREPTAGTVQVLGHYPGRQPRALRERTGVVLQECGFPRYLRVRELLDAWRRYYAHPRPLAELLEIVDLRGEDETAVRRLSGGQRRRLDFALALAGDPDLVYLDEPTTGFDPEARRNCWVAIDNLRALGKTILLTTHYLEEAERLADRVAILAAGRIQMSGSPRTLAREAQASVQITFSVPERVTDGLVSWPPELDVRIDGTRATVSTHDSSSVLRCLFAWVDRTGLAPLEDLTVTPPKLEDVYLLHLGAANHEAER